MSDAFLQKVQSLQFSEPQQANELLLDFLNQTLPFKVASVTIRPLAVSLNSINGFLMTVEGEKLFFKTHIEPQSIIDEYYNSAILAEAGYPIIQPIFSSNEWGKQLLVYKFFDLPSLFSVVRELETEKCQDINEVIQLQQTSDRQLFNIYFHTLQPLTAKEHAQAPIHQLFYHRLVGGRFAEFYQGKHFDLPQHILNYSDLAKLHWQINGITFQDNLDCLVKSATELLNPSLAEVPSIVGHGDAHNGNVFCDRTELIYFDPAFAGRHSPFLDLAKPLFHNVFAIWMYFPQAIASSLTLRYQIQGGRLIVDHNFQPSTVRLAILRSKLDNVLKPLLHELKQRGWLDPYWKTYLKLALFCCPFLTMNLGDRNRFPSVIGLLGMAIAVEMGSQGSDDLSLLDRELERVIIDL
jgi:hypothetical protein